MPDYGKIIRRSIEIVKNNKWLLVYGALISAGFSSSGGGGGGSSSSNNSNSINSPDFKLEDLPKKTSAVLGDFTTSVSTWFQSVSPLTWLLIILAFLITIIIGILVSMVLRNWAKASLIAGVQMALNDQAVDLKNTSPIGKAKTKSLIIYSIIIGTLVWGTLILLGGLFAGTYFLFKDTSLVAVWALLMVVPTVIFLIIGFMLVSMTSIYADRLIVLLNYTPWEAWKKGLSLSKGNFMATAIMSLINGITTGLFGCLSTIAALIVLGIPTFALIYPSISHKTWPSPVVWIFLAIFLLIFILTTALIGAASNVFVFSNWNQVFAEVLAKENEKGKNAQS